MNFTDSVDPLQYGWELKEETMMSVCSRDDIAMGTAEKEGAHLNRTI